MIERDPVRYHMSITKRHACYLVNRCGTKDVLPNWTGTKEGAIQAIMEMPGLIPMVECDNFDPQTGCLGHPAPEDPKK